MVGTEEFPVFGNKYTDIAAVFVDNVNYLFFPNGQKVEYIKAQDGDTGTTGFFNNNTSSSVANAGSVGTLNIEYNGVTAPDLVVGLLNPSLDVHTLKIVVSDVGDKVFDTSLYLDPIALAGAGFTATSDTSDVAFGTNGVDILTGDAGNNQLYGLAGDDKLRGRGGSDKLYGGSGDDTLKGGSGSDLLSGGSGADIFKYTAATNSGSTTAAADRIGDFSSAQGDKIQLTSDGFGGLSSLSAANYLELTYFGNDLGTLKTFLDDGGMDGRARTAGLADNAPYLAFLTFTDNATTFSGKAANDSGTFLI
jgi:Ca2+-binding RTX toxin-like protein